MTSDGGGDDPPDAAPHKRRRTDDEDAAAAGSTECPYLDTIERTLLDFDLEPACSVTLGRDHVYACLVCGRFFRGRGPQTPAHTHAVDEGHYVFLHLARGTVHCLPDDYVVRDPSLADIRAALRPVFAPEAVRQIDAAAAAPRRDLFGRRYLPGFVGLSNLNKTDGINCAVQALAHVPPLRDYFLSERERASDRRVTAGAAASAVAGHRLACQVTDAFGRLLRRLWSPDRFRATVDPHELVHAVAVASRKRFAVGRQCEMGELMVWRLHQLHLGTGGGARPGSSIVHRTFQGQVRVTTKEKRRHSVPSIEPVDGVESDGNQSFDGSDDEEGQRKDVPSPQPEFVIQETSADNHFLQLTLDLPDKPLFRDEDGGLVIPQEPLAMVLKKFDGVSFSDAITKSGVTQRKQYRLLKLPDYLILCISRFKKNSYTRVKNPAIVAFPVKNLDLGHYAQPDSPREPIPSKEKVERMTVKELRELLMRHGRKDIADTSVEKKDLVAAAVDFVTTSLPLLLADKYDLVANITHVSPADVGREGTHDALEEGYYKCHVQDRGGKQWFEIHDESVTEVMPQQIGVSESYLLIFERKSAQMGLNRSTKR